MKIDDFVELVGKMRAAQKEYFKFRKPEVMRESMNLEKAVDKALQEFKDEPTLF